MLINFGPSLDTIRSATTVLSAHTKFKAATPSPSNRYQSGLAFLFCIYSLGYNTPCFLFCLSKTILCYYFLGIWNLWGSDVPTFGISFNGMPTTQRVLDPNVLQRRADRLGYLVVVAYQSGLVTIRMIINKYDRSRGGTLNPYDNNKYDQKEVGTNTAPDTHSLSSGQCSATIRAASCLLSSFLASDLARDPNCNSGHWSSVSE